MNHKKGSIILPILLGMATAGVLVFSSPDSHAADEEMSAAVSDDDIARGRYLIRTSGCNDCHTSGYMEANGDLPEVQWLKGDSMGFRGPWGTTYPTNLRLFMLDLTEDEWVDLVPMIETRPPMPWFNLREMNEEDLRAMYRFVRHLGPAGEEAPVAVAPDEEPDTAYIHFVPQVPRAKS